MKTKLLLLLAASIATLSALAEDLSHYVTSRGAVIDLSNEPEHVVKQFLAREAEVYAKRAADAACADTAAAKIADAEARQHNASVQKLNAEYAAGRITVDQLERPTVTLDQYHQAVARLSAMGDPDSKLRHKWDEICMAFSPANPLFTQQDWPTVIAFMAQDLLQIAEKDGARIAEAQKQQYHTPSRGIYNGQPTSINGPQARVSGQLPPLDQWLSEGYSRGIPVQPLPKIPGLFDSVLPSLAPMQAQERINQQGREAERAEQAAKQQANAPGVGDAGTQDETNRLLREQLKAMKYAQAEAEIQAAKMLREQAAQAAAAAHRDYVNEGNRRWAEMQAANAAAAAQSAEVARQQQRDMQRIQDAQRGR